MIAPALTSSESTHWLTSPDVCDVVEQALDGIDNDYSSNRASVVPAKNSYYNGERDGFSVDWEGKVYLNPEYGPAIVRWVKKMCLVGGKTCELVGCVPGRIDTAWCQRIFASANAWCSWRGRIPFWRSWDPERELEELLADPVKRRGKLIPILRRLAAGELVGEFMRNANGILVGPDLNVKTGQVQPAAFPSLFPYFGPNVLRFARAFAPRGAVTIRTGKYRGVHLHPKHLREFRK